MSERCRPFYLPECEQFGVRMHIVGLAVNLIDKPPGSLVNTMRYENKNFLGVSHFTRVRLRCAFANSAGSQCAPGRVLSQLHDGGGLRCAWFPDHWRWKHRSWLVFA